MAKHTPWPWYAKGRTAEARDGPFAVYSTREPGAIAYVAWDNSEQTFANAHLIAAAPELLDALQGVVRTLDAVRYQVGLKGNQLERLERARAAIAKAKGESA